MNLTDFFLELASSYDRLAGLHSQAQELIANSAELLAEHAPAGIFVKGGGGKGMATYTPWVGFFNPDETDSPQRGLYVVLIVSQDMEMLALTLNQGMELLRKQYGDVGARERLAGDAAAIRSRLADTHDDIPSDHIDLRSKGARQQAYEAGNVACRMYPIGSLPSESVLRSDLAHVLQLYEEAIAVRRDVALAQPGTIASPSTTNVTTDVDPLINFRPKNDGDYIAHLVGRQLVKTRRHERLVAEYGRNRAAHGFTVSTQHPKDLELTDIASGTTFLVEAKVLYRGNATEAVRSAIGQLYEYSRFLYESTKPQKVGLFTEPIGDAYVMFLEECGIASVWWDDGAWHGSAIAEAHHLV